MKTVSRGPSWRSVPCNFIWTLSPSHSLSGPAFDRRGLSPHNTVNRSGMRKIIPRDMDCGGESRFGLIFALLHGK